MEYPYTQYIVHPPDQPSQTVKVMAFEKRGAQKKARMVLINMGEISPDIKYTELVVDANGRENNLQ